jgi:flagellar biosynthesis/type III secretory pathway chaperone
MKPSIKAKLSVLKTQLKADEELRRKDPRRAEVLRQARLKEEWKEVKATCVQLKLL